MSDLRELRIQLITALHNADCLCHDTPTHFAAQYTPQADAALAVFADWLLDRALMRDSSWLPSDPFATDDGRGYVGAALDVLADEITAAISHTRRDTPDDPGTGGTE